MNRQSSVTRWGTLLTICLSLLAGCNSEPKKELSVMPRHEGLPIFGNDVVAFATITRIWLPTDQTIDTLWQHASTAELSPTEVQNWQENQLRAAVIDRNVLKQLLGEVPVYYGVHTQVMTMTSSLSELEPASLAAARQETVVVSDQQTQKHHGGLMRILISAAPQPGDALKLTLIPMDYRPVMSLMPRSNEQSVLDGKLMTSLMLRTMLKTGQVLMVAPGFPMPVYDDTRPLPAPAPQQEGDEAMTPQDAALALQQGDTTQATAEPQEPAEPVSKELVIPPLSNEPEKTVVPYGLGKALLTGRQFQVDMHQLMIIELHPLLLTASEQ